jgi:hypothetical protein
MPTTGRRTADCTPAQGRSRLRQAEAFVMVADLVLSDDTDTATPGVAAALAVLAGIAASDAACCAKLRKRARGQDHTEAIKLLRAVVPHGEDMARDLGRLLAAKDESHYGVTLVDRAKAPPTAGVRESDHCTGRPGSCGVAFGSRRMNKRPVMHRSSHPRRGPRTPCPR